MNFDINFGSGLRVTVSIYYTEHTSIYVLYLADFKGKRRRGVLGPRLYIGSMVAMCLGARTERIC